MKRRYKMKRMTGIALLGLFLGLCVPTFAVADNTTAANAEFLFLGEVAEDFIGASGGGSDQSWWKVHLVARRSYSFSAWAPDTDASEASVSLDLDMFADDGTTTPAGVSHTDVEPRIDIIAAHAGDQLTFIPNATGTYRLRVRNLTAAAYNVHVLGIETTLFSPWYFVDTTSGYEGFVEIRNSTSQTLAVTVTAYNASGGIVGTTTVNLAANGNTVVTMGATFGARGRGSVQIAHRGTAGAVAANITTLSATTGLSFDAPFTPRMTWSSFKR
jgi:hypothetical protein